MIADTEATNERLTPILDRQTPLPTTAATRSSARLLISVGLIVVSATIGVLYASYRPLSLHELQAMCPDLFPDRWTGVSIIYLGLIALVVPRLAVAVHEIGHVVGGLCAGFRFNAVRIGPLFIHRGFRISHYRGPGAWLGGAAHMIPESSERLSMRALALVCAGPAASIVTGSAVLLLPAKGLAAWTFGLTALAGGLGDLVPFRFRGIVSDGARIGMLLRNRGQGERWLALVRLGADLSAGVPPETLPAEYVARAIAVLDDSPDTVAAHAIAYSRAYWRHEDLEAGQRLETCLRFSTSVEPAVRSALLSDAAVFQARKRQRVDLAEGWLADLRATSPTPWVLSRAEAAVLEGRGDVAGCLRKLEECETAIRAIPDEGQRKFLLRVLLRWLDELPGA